MSHLLFHPRLRFVVLCYLPVKDLLNGYRPVSSRSTEGTLEHIAEVIIEYLNRGSEFSSRSFSREYWGPFCKLQLADEPKFLETIKLMLSPVPADWSTYQRQNVARLWSNMGNLVAGDHVNVATGANKGILMYTDQLFDAFTPSRRKSTFSQEFNATAKGFASTLNLP